MNDNRTVLVALGAAIAIGLIAGATGSATVMRLTDSLTPLGVLWVNGIRMTVIPLVVALIITAVASAADVRSVSVLGARTLVVFVLLLAGAAAIIIPVATAIFSWLPADLARPVVPAGAAAAAEQVATQRQTFGEWLPSLLPANPVGAAANGQLVSLILFTLLLALAIARTAPATRVTLVGFFGALAEAMLVLVGWIVKLAPAGVFALVLPLAARSGAQLAGAIGFYILAYVSTNIGMALLLYPLVAIVARVPMTRFARAALPVQLIGLGTSSSIACLPALITSAEEGLRVPQRVSAFVLPLAVSTFKLAAPVAWTVGALFIGWFYGVPLGPRALATIAFAGVFLSFAAPGVPRGAFIMLAPLFVAIGLPVEGIGILLAVDVIPDLSSTILNVTGDLAAAVLIGRGAGREP